MGMPRRVCFSLVIIVGSLVTMVVGLMRGEAVKIMQKAITLCLQCMGIG